MWHGAAPVLYISHLSPRSGRYISARPGFVPNNSIHHRAVGNFWYSKSSRQDAGNFSTIIQSGVHWHTAVIMSSAARVWGACRALAVRTRPIATQRSDSIFAAVAVLRTYSADTTNKPPVLPSNQSPTEPTSVKPAPSSRDDGTAPTVPVSEAEGFTEIVSTSKPSGGFWGDSGSDGRAAGMNIIFDFIA